MITEKTEMVNRSIVYFPLYRDGIPVFGDFMWVDNNGESWQMSGDAKDLPKKALDNLLTDFATPLENFIEEKKRGA